MSESVVHRARLRVGIIMYVLAAITFVLAIVTAMSPTWMETALGISPDAGSGDAEWGIVLAFAAASVGFAGIGMRVRALATSRS